MKTFEKPKIAIQIQREMPKPEQGLIYLECIFGVHKADLLHKGTAYCRNHYEERARTGSLIN